MKATKQTLIAEAMEKKGINYSEAKLYLDLYLDIIKEFLCKKDVESVSLSGIGIIKKKLTPIRTYIKKNGEKIKAGGNQSIKLTASKVIKKEMSK